MLTNIGPYLGAFIATYFLSRVLLRLPLPVSGWQRVVGAHVVSLAMLIVAVGLMKAYFVTFALDPALIFVAPQLFWLAADLIRGKSQTA